MLLLLASRNSRSAAHARRSTAGRPPSLLLMGSKHPRPKTVEPTEDGRRLRIVWHDGHVSELEPRALRLACPCAGCVDEMSGRPLLNPVEVPEDIMPESIRYVGRYALGFQWSDGHDTGIFPWDLLRRLCPCEACA